MKTRKPDTPWEAYTAEIDRRTYCGHELVVIALKTRVMWFVDEYRMKSAPDRASARAAAERFAESEGNE
jgi:hypothetical protein